MNSLRGDSMELTEFQIKKIGAFLEKFGIFFNVEDKKIDTLGSHRYGVKYSEEEVSKSKAAKIIHDYKPWVKEESLGLVRMFSAVISEREVDRTSNIIIATDVDGQTPAKLYVFIEDNNTKCLMTLCDKNTQVSRENPEFIIEFGPKQNMHVGLNISSCFGDLTSMVFINNEVLLDTTFDKIQERDNNGKTIPYVFGKDDLSEENYIKAVEEKLRRWNANNVNRSDRELELIRDLLVGEVHDFFEDIKERPEHYIARFTAYGDQMKSKFDDQLAAHQAQMEAINAKKSEESQKVESGIQFVKKLSEENK